MIEYSLCVVHPVNATPLCSSENNLILQNVHKIVPRSWQIISIMETGSRLTGVVSRVGAATACNERIVLCE